MKLAELLATVKPGSRDWSWQQEAINIIHYDAIHMALLIESIQVYGQQRPVVIGSDGRLWDGHHRVVAHILLMREDIDVTYDTEECA